MTLRFKRTNDNRPEEAIPSTQEMVGVCYSCKTQIRTTYANAVPPSRNTFAGPNRMENDLYSCECPKCGAKAYLSVPNYRKIPKIDSPIDLKGPNDESSR